MHLGKDKILHIQVCAAIALVVALIAGILHAPVAASAICGYMASISAGLGKEYGDKVNPNNKWDWEDVLADIIGGMSGALLAAIILLIV